MKKILLLADVNSPHTLRWLDALASDDSFDVAVFSLAPVTAAIPGNVRVCAAGIDGHTSRVSGVLKKVALYTSVLPRLRRFVKAFQPDCVHAMYATSYGLLGALLNVKPFFVSAWGTDVFVFPRRNALNRFLLRFILRKAGRVYSTSRFMADEMKRYCSLPARVIPYGVDTARFRPALRAVQNTGDANTVVIGSLKSLEPTYGIDILIRAFALLVKRLPQQSLRLSIVGGGSLEADLRSLAFELGCNDTVAFEGPVPYSEAPRYHQSFNIFVAPTRHESFGVSLLEAMATGKPIVATDIPPYREIDGGCNVLRFARATPESLCSELEKLIQEKHSWPCLGEAARRRVCEAFDAEPLKEEIRSQYR